MHTCAWIVDKAWLHLLQSNRPICNRYWSKWRACAVLGHCRRSKFSQSKVLIIEREVASQTPTSNISTHIDGGTNLQVEGATFNALILSIITLSTNICLLFLYISGDNSEKLLMYFDFWMINYIIYKIFNETDMNNKCTSLNCNGNGIKFTYWWVTLKGTFGN